MSILKIPYCSALDFKLEKMWYEEVSPCDWTDFIKKLDPNIIDVEIIPNRISNDTHIIFVKEEHISWFILRWS